VSGFIDNAVRILEAAENVAAAGEAPSDFTILMGSKGGIRIIADSDWPLESLLRERGADMGYRVKSGVDRVSVDGREGNKTCRFESACPAQTARMLLNAAPYSYTFAQPALAA